MLGDPTRLKQVLTNLISNAIKFTEKGSILVRVVVEESSKDNYLIRTTITDTGMGMTDEQISKLFQPFSQVNQKINRHHSGTGLGLVISKKLIEQMDGTISIESKSNEGTSFSFTFRAQKPNEQSKNQQLDLTPKLQCSNQQIYLYDYHPMALLAMKQLLLSWSITVSAFQNIDKLIRTVLLLTQTPENVQEKSKPLIIIGLPNENNDIVHKIQNTIEIQGLESKIKGVLFIGHLKYINKNESLMNNSLLHYLEKPLTRKQLKNSFNKIGLLSIEQQVVDKIEPIDLQFSGLRVLVVDDNPDNLKLITIVLEEMLIDVIQAYDGLSAIELCKDEHFDLIFMDIRMPGIDGVESSKRIHLHSLNSSTPIIALTAHAMSGEKEQLLESGLQDYMTKPISSGHLKQLINQWTKPKDSQLSCEQIDSIDWDKALEITAGREDIALELFEALYVKIPQFKRHLNKATNNSIAELLSNTHKFHGLTCYTGVPKLQRLTRSLEEQLKCQKTFAELKVTIALLLTEIEQVERAAINYVVQENCTLS
jgi:two-component system sensor histidine kinase BarA